jgi:hypothetical protein
MADCPSKHAPGYRFQFDSRGDHSALCLRHAISFGPLVRTALATAAVVGLVLVAINQGNILLDGHFPGDLFWKIPMTFSVPYCVATYAGLQMARVSATG